jgi:hypothetical protein
MSLRGYNLPIYELTEIKQLLKEGEYVEHPSIQMSEKGPLLSFSIREMRPDVDGKW